MRTLAAIAAAALTLAGCTTGTTTAEGSPAVRHVAISRLLEQPAHDDELPLGQAPGPVDPSDPAAVAVALVLAGLNDQGLEVVDLGAQRLPARRDVVTIRVAATHRMEAAGAAHTSVYELDLTRDPGGSWRLVGFRQDH